MNHSDFVKTVAAYIKKYAPVYGIEVVSPIIAQAVLESGYGTSELAVNAHNYFGLKYREGRCKTCIGIYHMVGNEQNADGSYTSSAMQWCKFKDMNMIRTCLCFYDLYPLLFTQLSKYLSDISPDLAVYCHPAIFWGKYHMILASPCCVLQTFYIFFFHRKDLLVFIVAVDRPQLYFTRRFFHYIISFTLPGLAGGCRFAKAY